MEAKQDEEGICLSQSCRLRRLAFDVLTKEGNARFLSAHSCQHSSVLTGVVCRVHHSLQPRELGICLLTDELKEEERQWWIQGVRCITK